MSEDKKVKQGRQLKNPDIKYQEIRKPRTKELVKVVAILSKTKSAEYTRLGRNLKRLEFLRKQTKKINDELKSDTRLNIAALFNAEDSVVMRVVKTVSFMLTLSKDPAPVKSISYKNVLDDLSKELTPELNQRLEELIKVHTTIQTRAPQLKFIDLKTAEDSSEARVDEAVSSNIVSQINNSLTTLADNFEQWGEEYDQELQELEQQL